VGFSTRSSDERVRSQVDRPAATDMGHRPTVICAPTIAHPTALGLELEGDLPADLAILRPDCALRPDTNSPATRPSYRLFPQVDGEFYSALLMADLALRCLRDDPPSIVLACGPRFSNFVAGYLVARWAGADLALYYGDEWTVNTPPFISIGRDDRRWEARCLEAARHVVFVSEGKSDAYRAAFPAVAERIRVHENGWDPMAFARAGHPAIPDGAGTLTIDYIGVTDEQTPIDEFYRTLAAALDIRPSLRNRVAVRMTGTATRHGRQAADWASAHGIQVEQRGTVPMTEAVRAMMTSDACLLLLNTRYDSVVPTKTFEYMRAGSPILAYGTTSRAVRIIEETGAGPVVPVGDAAALAAAMDDLIARPRTYWRTERRAAWSASRNRETIAREMLDQLFSARSEPRSSPSRH
jgi:glycosyltransferase involved in cell wall biosynthesis